MDSNIYSLIIVLKKSTYRLKVFQAIAHTQFTIPKEISHKTGIIINHVSNTLIDLKRLGLICCVNEASKRNRGYLLTPLGEQILNQWKKVD